MEQDNIAQRNTQVYLTLAKGYSKEGTFYHFINTYDSAIERERQLKTVLKEK